jgi:hypothetical protein
MSLYFKTVHKLSELTTAHNFKSQIHHGNDGGFDSPYDDLSPTP